MFNSYRQAECDVQGHILGIFNLNLKGIDASLVKWFFFGMLFLNVAALFGAAWLFQIFWTWFIPAVAPMLPHVISYWHAFASVVLMMMFMPKSSKS